MISVHGYTLNLVLFVSKEYWIAHKSFHVNYCGKFDRVKSSLTSMAEKQIFKILFAVHVHVHD